MRYAHRLVSATHSDPNYSLGLVQYDKMGNITRLIRNGHRDVSASSFGLMDDLTYSYQGNQLQAVDDAIAASAVTGFKDGAEATTEYFYDGNLTNKLGVKGVKNLVNDFGKELGVHKVIIQGAKRTTGANPGKITNLEFDIEK